MSPHAFSKKLEALHCAGERFMQAIRDHNTWASAPRPWEEARRREANLERRSRRYFKRQNDLIEEVMRARNNAQTT
jgi:hypothetical protein